MNERLQEYAEELRRDFSGEIRTDRFACALYSTDASIYQIDPLAVLVPQSHDDAAAAVSLACRHRLPLLPRGAGTSLAGQTVGSALVIDCSKYMNRILEVNPAERFARVQPGAEHGDGITRSHWNGELFGERLYSAFQQLKAAFDPAGTMKPGKIVNAPPMTSHLRRGPDRRAQELHCRGPGQRAR